MFLVIKFWNYKWFLHTAHTVGFWMFIQLLITSPESVESRYRIRENRLLNIAILGAHTYTRHRVRSTIHLNRKQVVPKSKHFILNWRFTLIKMDLSLNRVDYLQVSSLNFLLTIGFYVTRPKLPQETKVSDYCGVLSKWELPPLPPSFLELWRKERASRQLSFWWKTLILIGHYGSFFGSC